MNLPELKIRTFTTDQAELDKCFYGNFYKLKSLKDKNVTIMDVGAHCGYFSFAALALGAKNIYAFEPFLENYRVLIENTKGADNIATYQIGAYTNNSFLKLNYPEIKEGSYYDFADLDEGKERKFAVCAVFPISTLFELTNEKEIDILKINLGYAEFEILMGSTITQDKIKNICLASKEDIISIESFATFMKTKGYSESFIQKSEETGTHLVIIGKDTNKYFNI